MKECDLVFDVLHGVLEFPALAAGPCFNTTHISFSRIEVRLCRVDSRFLNSDDDLIGLRVEFDEKISLVYAVVVVHQNPGHLTRHAGRHERHMTVHIGIIGRNGGEH